MFKKIGILLTQLFICAALMCQASAGDYFSAYSPDYDWTHNQSCFHTKQFTYLYSEKINIIEDGFLYLPEFPRLRLTIRDQDGNEREDGETIKTGDRLTEWRDGKFEVLSTFIYLGDVEADGQIDAADARKTLRASIGLIDLSDTEKEAADLDNDGSITPADARTILRESVHLKTNVAKKGNSREDYFYRTSLLVWMQEQDCDARIAALRSTYDEITDVRILAEEYISDDSRAVIVLLNVETYENKNSLAEKIKDNEKNIIINSYSLL